jgi:predicted transposase YbfD/YdcC
MDVVDPFTEVLVMARMAPLAECFSEAVDPRDPRWVFHELTDILSLAVLAVIAGAEGWEDIEEFGKQKQAWLKRFLRLPGGVPSHDTISRVFRRIDPRAFQEGFARWIESLHKDLGLKLVAVDGKTLRRSHDRRAMKSALHAASAWGVENHVLLGQQACAEKSNEIAAIPELLKLLDLSGAIVTIDAMGCQKEIAQKIIDGGGDYVLAVKGNQEKLHAAIAEHFDELHESDFNNSDCRRRRTEEKGRGRLEQRYYYQSPLPESLQPFVKGWKGLATIGQVISITEREGEECSEVRYYISSLGPGVKRFAKAVRGHWGIENSLHWVLDVSFNEDQSRIRKDHGPDNFALLRRFAVTLIKQDASPGSAQKKRKRAAWNNEALQKIAKLTT